MQQLSLELANARADLGVERAARKADRVAAGWIEIALDKIREFSHGMSWLYSDFTIEDARSWVEVVAPRPDGVDGRVWGHITREACARGLIERIPGKFRAAASSNGAPKPVYRKGPKA